MTTRILRERDACFQCIWAHNTYFRRHVDELDARPRVECRITGRQGKLYCDACQLSHHACEKVCLSTTWTTPSSLPGAYLSDNV